MNPFCKTLPFQLRFWDGTALAGYMKCPRFHYYQVHAGWRGEGSVHLDFGTLLHGAADVYNKSLASRLRVLKPDSVDAQAIAAEEATLDAVGWALEAAWPAKQADPWGGHYRHVWWCNKGTVSERRNGKKVNLRCPHAKGKWLVDEAAPHECPTCGGETLEQIAFFGLDKVKNHQTLIRSVIAYCDELTKSAYRPVILPDGRIGSEMRFAHELDRITPDGDRYIITGTWDGLSTLGALDDDPDLIIPDIKTTQKTPNEGYFGQFAPSVQFLTYGWAGAKGFPRERPQPHIVCVHVQQSNTDVYIYPLRHTPNSLAEHEVDMQYWIARAEDDARSAEVLARDGRDPAEAYRRNTTACNSCPGAPNTPCAFRDICRLDPTERGAFLRSNFRRDPWNPIEVK